MEPSGSQVSPKQAAHDLEQARERRAAAWILILAMAISAIVAMVVTVLLQRP
jgi:hypothetical protein